MRRPFLRIPGSPQATPVVETPAQYAPTLFLELARLFGGGDWECQSLICLFVPKNGCKGTHFRPIKCLFCVKKHKIGANGADFQRKAWWNGSFFVILASVKTSRGKVKAVTSKKG